MARDTKHMMRTLIVLLLFQFISPSLFSVVTLGSVTGKEKASLTPSHSSIVVPIFLREQEERDHDETPVKAFDLPLLIDFSNHSFTHTASQSLVYKGYNHLVRFGYARPLFELNCTFLI